MDHRLIQPASRDQIVAIIRQRAERANRDLPAHLGQALFPAPAFIDFPARERAREMEPGDVRDAGNRAGGAVAYRRRAEEEVKPRTERISVAGSTLQYQGDKGLPGLYISGTPLSPDRAYFEAEITFAEGGGGPVVGLCSHRCPANLLFIINQKFIGQVPLGPPTRLDCRKCGLSYWGRQALQRQTPGSTLWSQVAMLNVK